MKKGDEVLCILYGNWAKINGNLSTGPKKNEVYTVTGTSEALGIFLITVVGYGSERYQASCFRKVEPKKFTNSVTNELANKPVVKEGLEKVKETTKV